MKSCRDRTRHITDERRRRYYEKVIYYRCTLCSQRWNIFMIEHNMIEHLLKEHKLKLDGDDKIAFLRRYYGRTHLTEKECLEYGIDYDRFKKITEVKK